MTSGSPGEMSGGIGPGEFLGGDKCPGSTHGRQTSVTGPAVWNSLPDNLRDSDVGTDSFRRCLKTFLCASLAVMRGAYRRCRDVVGLQLVTFVNCRFLWILGLQWPFETNRKPYPGIQWYRFQPPSVTPNLRSEHALLEFWRFTTYYYDDFRLL